MGRERDPAFEAWVERARQGSFEQAAALCGFVPARGKDKGADRAGPCPACGGRDRFAVHFGKRQFNCRHCGAKGRDALALALVGDHVAFVEAAEALSGEGRPARVGAESAEERAARARRQEENAAARAADAARREAESDRWRAREREACARIWEAGRPPSGAIVRAYLAARRLDLPATALIRECADLPYYHGEELDPTGRPRPAVIWRGPAMLARMLDAEGAAVGLHITWLAHDLTGKAAIMDPATGEVLPAKKMRGSKKGARIVLREPPVLTRLFLGEGIETVLSVAVALRLAGRLLPGDGFWAAGDLGNLGGPASGTVAHPTLRGPKGRPMRVAGPIPAQGAAAAAGSLVVPSSVATLVLLGDGDSDPFTTRQHLARAEARHTAPGRLIRQAWAPPGQDFNDVLREDAA